eukprot:scaffold373_cov350-Pavlova_lutheri.AAC.4
MARGVCSSPVRFAPSFVLSFSRQVGFLRRRIEPGRTSASWVSGSRAWAAAWARLPAHRTFRCAWRRGSFRRPSWDGWAASLRAWP